MLAVLKKLITRAVPVVVVAVVAFFAWQHYREGALPEYIVGSNGRIEAVSIDIAARISGRIEDILVKEGDYVHRGQILARLDTATLNAQLREAEAQLQRALTGIDTSESQVMQREAECKVADATVLQRQAERTAAEKKMQRTEELAKTGTTTQQAVDDDRARLESARAAVAAAKAQVTAAEAACSFAKSQVVASQSAVEAAQATVDRIKTDIDDSVLKSPREGRIQYRVAEPGEIISAGLPILNMVDLTDVYMTFFLGTEQAGLIPIGADARIVLDAAPEYVIPAKITFVADVAQFTPKTVETREERQKLMFRIKAQVDASLLQNYLPYIKTGLPGMTYVRLDQSAEWPTELQVNLP